MPEFQWHCTRIVPWQDLWAVCLEFALALHDLWGLSHTKRLFKPNNYASEASYKNSEFLKLLDSCFPRICSFFMGSNMKHTNHICKIRVDMFHSPFPPPFLYLKNTSQNARLHVLKSLENMTQRRHRVRKKILGNKLLSLWLCDSSLSTSLLSHFFFL